MEELEIITAKCFSCSYCYTCRYYQNSLWDWYIFTHPEDGCPAEKYEFDSLYKELHYHVALCSKNKVVCINSDSAYPNILNKEISLHVQEEIEKRKTSQFVHEDLNNENKYYNFFAYPLAYDSELFGCLLVFSSTPLSNEENKILMSFRNLLTTFIRQ